MKKTLLRVLYRRRGETGAAETRLTTPDLLDAELLLLKDIQRRHFQKEFAALAMQPAKPSKRPSVRPSSTVAALNPFVDDAGFLRCRGRLEKADYLAFDAKHPIILPHNDDAVLELVRGLHERCLHAGVEQILGESRRRFWITKGRQRLCCAKCKIIPFYFVHYLQLTQMVTAFQTT